MGNLVIKETKVYLYDKKFGAKRLILKGHSSGYLESRPKSYLENSNGRYITFGFTIDNIKKDYEDLLKLSGICSRKCYALTLKLKALDTVTDKLVKYTMRSDRVEIDRFEDNYIQILIDTDKCKDGIGLVAFKK